MSASLWRGFSDFGDAHDSGDPDDPILGYPICEVCGWKGYPITSPHELHDDENWQHRCGTPLTLRNCRIDSISLCLYPLHPEWTVRSVEP